MPFSREDLLAPVLQENSLVWGDRGVEKARSLRSVAAQGAPLAQAGQENKFPVRERHTEGQKEGRSYLMMLLISLFC